MGLSKAQVIGYCVDDSEATEALGLQLVTDDVGVDLRLEVVGSPIIIRGPPSPRHDTPCAAGGPVIFVSSSNCGPHRSGDRFKRFSLS